MPFFNDGREQALHSYILSLPQEPLKNNPPALLSAINNFTTNQTRMMVFQSEKIEICRETLEQMDPKPKTFLELGCYVGVSAVFWGSLLKEFYPNAEQEGFKVYTCELEEAFAKITRDFLRIAGLSALVEVIVGTSSDSIKKLADEGQLKEGGVDVLFLDHWERYYLPDLQICEDLGLFRKGSVVLADNTDMPGAPEYLEYVKKGGRGGEGGVKLKSKSVSVEGGKGPKVVEITEVVGV